MISLFYDNSLITFSGVQVPECIEKLGQAGIKIWVLTGDKMETAVNIGYCKKFGIETFVLENIYIYVCFNFLEVTCCYYFNCPRYACSLLKQDMKQIVITLDSPDIDALEKQGNKDAIAQVQDLEQRTLKFFFLVVNV